MQDEKQRRMYFRAARDGNPHTFWVSMEDKTDRPMVQLDDGRMAHTDRRKKYGEKLCPQLIREDNHRNKLPLFHSRQQILTRPKTISST
jgi:hypothetical protein